MPLEEARKQFAGTLILSFPDERPVPPLPDVLELLLRARDLPAAARRRQDANATTPHGPLRLDQT